MGAGARLPWGLVDSRVAARSGHLDVLKWARWNDCPEMPIVCLVRSHRRVPLASPERARAQARGMRSVWGTGLGGAAARPHP